MNAKHFSTLELKAREILARADTDIDWSPARVTIKSVFTALWINALSAERVAEVGAALLGVKTDAAEVQRTLTKFVRAGILRSRVDCRERLYEINFTADA